MEEFKQKGAAVQIRAASAQTELMDRYGGDQYANRSLDRDSER